MKFVNKLLLKTWLFLSFKIFFKWRRKEFVQRNPNRKITHHVPLENMPEGDKSSTFIVEHRSSDVYEHEPISSECPSGGGRGIEGISERVKLSFYL